MGPDSLSVAVIGVVLTVAAAVLLATVWGVSRGWWRFTLRVTAATLCLLTVTACAAVGANRLSGAYPTWGSLLSPVSAAPIAAPDVHPDLTGSAYTPADQPLNGPAGGTGRIVSFPVTGKASGISMTAWAYLPAAYATNKATSFPVIEAFHGFPGSPRTWLDGLHVQHHLDAEISSGRMAPTVVVFPYQTPSPLLDTECTDLVRGPKTETYLTTDVAAAVQARFRVRTDRAGWGLVGYSAGGFCAVNLALRHPDRFAAAASMSGYADPGITIGDGSERTTNNPAWRLQHLPQPPSGLYLGYAADDRHAVRDATLLTRLAHRPLSVTTAVVAHGGHTRASWTAMEAPAFDWLSGRLARPVTLR